jgi:WD40 repeat protein
MNKQQDLKETLDGLSKVWKVCDSHVPFYSGGHVEVVLAPSVTSASSDVDANTPTNFDVLACMFEDNIKLMNWTTGRHEITLLPEGEDNDAHEKVSTFCMHPSGMELVLANPAGLLRHYSCRQAKVADAVTNEQVKETTSRTNASEIKPSKTKWEFVRAIKAHTMPVLTMSYDPTGTLVATGSADRLVKVWDVARGHCTHVFRGHTDVIHLVQFHVPASFYQPMHNDRGMHNMSSLGSNLKLYTSSHDHTVKMFDLNDSQCIATHKQHMSVPTAVATASASGDEYLLASVGRDKVINFYNTRTHSHLHTTACMDELETCFFMNTEHTENILGKNTFDSNTNMYSHVFVAAGARGVLRIYSVTYSYSASKRENAGAFTCALLVMMPVSGSEVSARTCIPRIGLSTVPARADDEQEVQAISKLLYMPHCSHTHVVAVTADQSFSCYELCSSPQQSKQDHMQNVESASKSKKRRAETAAATQQTEMVLRRQLVGTHDDILDLCCLPILENHRQDNGTFSVQKHYQLAIASNSPYIRLTDMLPSKDIIDDRNSTRRSNRSVMLYGHTDVVLALDGSPDG